MSKEIKQWKADAAGDAEQILTFFVHRDIMNAFVHMENNGRGVNVRYSPITYAAERLMASAWEDAYGTDTKESAYSGINTGPTIAQIAGRKG